jgi:hypothetical protein
MTERVGFKIAHSEIVNGDTHNWMVFCLCPKCGSGSVAHLLFVGTGRITRPEETQIDPLDRDYSIVGFWPKTEVLKAPDHTPDNIRKFYLQGMDNLRRGHFDAAGAMFRKTLDIGTRALDHNLPDNLNKRIDVLVASGMITMDMGNWAHQIRLGGNEAVHDDDEFSKDDAADLAAFTELFLMYAFTLPGMLADRKTRKGL